MLTPGQASGKEQHGETIVSWQLKSAGCTECTTPATIYDPLPIILTLVLTGLPFSPIDNVPFTLLC